MQRNSQIVSNKTTNSLIDELIRSGRDEAFYVCNLDVIKEKHKIWLATLPRVKPHYVVKCNYEKPIIETLASVGVNFTCAVKNDMDLVVSTNVKPENILYSNYIKTPIHLQHAHKLNINLTTVENEFEMKKVREFMPNAKALLTIKYGDSNDDEDPDHFGCDPVKEGPRLLQTAKDIGLEITGINFQLGPAQSPNVIRNILKECRSLFNVAKTIGFDMKILDIGDAFDGNLEKFKVVAGLVNAGLEQFFPDPAVQVIAEPASYYVEECCTLVCNITSVRCVCDAEPDKVSHVMYYIDDGIYGSFMQVSFGGTKKPTPLGPVNGGEMLSSSIWGPTGDCFDIVNKSCALPLMNMGDWIKFDNMGAHTISGATSFNGFTLPKLYFVQDNTCALPVNK